MSSTTTLGYPYPDPTDAVAGLAVAVQALAQMIDDELGLIKTGTQNSGVLVVSTSKTIAVTFAAAFPTGHVPRVCVTVAGGQGTVECQATVASVTEAGFDLLVRRESGTGALDVHYIAVAK